MTASGLLLALAALAAPAWSPPFAVDRLERVLGGAGEVNGVPAQYGVWSLEDGAPDLGARLAAAGWTAAPLPAGSARPAGDGLRLRAFTGHGRWLLLAAPAGAEILAAAWFASRPRWPAAGDAPGRDPAGWPRLGAATRILHIKGAGCEAACYRSPAPAAAVVDEAARRLPAGGWRVSRAGAGSLAAWRVGRPDTVLRALAADPGSLFIVLAAAP